ncbi:TasA family protein [Alkalibacillus haloalkaliphilus]|uniref:TasA family protein n=1 Tax=Alkalibacillus haloalkaliphilus TaxID=94136 RepID=UPI002936BF7D|nr:TasA family protein [Alkalibacillus haloalkaliphilus]MDV2581280.1 TasA family protein [Alkalibacillus haloalkaliphilus]
MKNTKKILGTLALTGAILAGGAFGTYSYFSDTVETDGEITAGTLYFDDKFHTELGLFQDVIAPGEADAVEGEEITIKNAGSLDMYMRFSLDFSVDQDVDLGEFEVKVEDYIDNYTSVNELDDEWYYYNGELGQEDAEIISVDVMLSDEAGNEYQGVKLNANLVVEGVQASGDFENNIEEAFDQVNVEAVQ